MSIYSNILLAAMTPGNWIAVTAVFIPIVIALIVGYGNMKHWQGLTHACLTNLNCRIDKMDEKFDKFLMTAFATSKSPLKLNENGLKMFNRVKVQEFVKAKSDEIIEKMKSVSHESAYQAQEALGKLVDSYKTGGYKTLLENEAYETGQHIDILMKVISIGIRDKVFENIGLSTNDIDATDPNKKDSSK